MSKIYILPRSPSYPRFRAATAAEQATYEAEKKAREDALLDLCRDASPLLAGMTPNCDGLRSEISFDFGSNDSGIYTHATLNIKQITGGYLEARVDCGYGSRDQFRRFPVKQRVIDPKALDGIRELAQLAFDRVQNQKAAAIATKEREQTEATQLAANVTALKAAGFEVPEGFSTPEVKAGNVAFYVRHNGLELNYLAKGVRIPIGRAAEFIALFASLKN